MNWHAWRDVVGVEGPARVWAFDLDNPLSTPVHAQLIRGNGLVLVDHWVPPYNAHPPETSTANDVEGWLWSLEPNDIVVSEDDKVVLRVEIGAASLAGLRGYIAYLGGRVTATLSGEDGGIVAYES